MANKGNIENFKHSFQEEAREILAELEATLLALHQNPHDLELVGKAFRGLHTIKGSGAMFGFEDLAVFTHNLENAFDEVRNERLAVTPELINLTLAALDQIKCMVEDGVGVLADPAVCADLLSKVRRLCGVPKSEADHEALQAIPAAATLSPAMVGGTVCDWQIHFAPGPDLMRDGTNPLLLLRELRQLGSLQIQASLASLPPLEELDPERCYFSWDMTLTAACTRDAIRDVFIFVEESCELTIAPVSSTVTPALEPLFEPSLEPRLRPGQKSGLESIPASILAPGMAPAAPVQLSASDAIANGLKDQRSGAAGRRPYNKPDNAASIRVPAAKLDQFVDLVGELVTVQARLSEIAAQRNDTDVIAVSEEIERLTSALRENSMNIRMLPIRATFERFRRLVHDLARDLGKDVELTIEGADTELDKTVIDQLGDPLMHLIRNSMDHGIEPAEARAAAGKSPTARIHLSARHSGATVLIAVSDDGGGIKADAVRARAVERGLVSADAQLTEAEVFALIFEPGFSTAPQVTDVSGRGVGMDVVRQRVESLRGIIDVASKPGVGTSVTLRLPLTLAIIDGLLVSVDCAYFVLPLANTLECIELTQQDIERANGKHVANVRGEIIPYIRLRQHFNIRTARPEIEQIMVVETEDGRFGLVVDRVLGDCQSVIKSLGRFYKHVQVVSGATILGNGCVALILAPDRLVQEAIRASSPGPRGHPPAATRNNRTASGARARTASGAA